MTLTQSYTYKTDYVWVLSTNGKIRLAFKSEKKAYEYAGKDKANVIQKVYCGITKVLLDN